MRTFFFRTNLGDNAFFKAQSTGRIPDVFLFTIIINLCTTWERGLDTPTNAHDYR